MPLAPHSVFFWTTGKLILMAFSLFCWTMTLAHTTNLTILSFFGDTSKTPYSHLSISSLQLTRKGLTVTLNGSPPWLDTSSTRFTPKGRNEGLIQLLRTHHASLLLNPFFTLKSPTQEPHLSPLW